MKEEAGGREKEEGEEKSKREPRKVRSKFCIVERLTLIDSVKVGLSSSEIVD